jgi:hypothetical protein
LPLKDKGGPVQKRHFVDRVTVLQVVGGLSPRDRIVKSQTELKQGTPESRSEKISESVAAPEPNKSKDKKRQGTPPR